MSVSCTTFESVLTWNNFFCNTNSTGQIVVNGICSFLSSGHILLGTEDDVSQLNLTGWLTKTDTIRTIIIAPSTEPELQWIGRSSDDSEASKRHYVCCGWVCYYSYSHVK